MEPNSTEEGSTVNLSEEEKQFLDLLASIHLRVLRKKAEELYSHKDDPFKNEKGTNTSNSPELAESE